METSYNRAGNRNVPAKTAVCPCHFGYPHPVIGNCDLWKMHENTFIFTKTLILCILFIRGERICPLRVKLSMPFPNYTEDAEFDEIMYRLYVINKIKES